jgi:hypothetical protein
MRVVFSKQSFVSYSFMSILRIYSSLSESNVKGQARDKLAALDAPWLWINEYWLLQKKAGLYGSMSKARRLQMEPTN